MPPTAAIGGEMAADPVLAERQQIGQVLDLPRALQPQRRAGPAAAPRCRAARGVSSSGTEPSKPIDRL